jgi:hypothetical protein
MVVTHGETVYVDLAASNEEIWHQTRLSDRNNISWLRRNGYGARVDDTWGRFADFKGIYRDTMARVGASSDYYFDGAYFDALRSGLGDRLHLIVVEAGSETAAAGLFTEENGIVQFHLSGTAEAHRQHGPSRLMLDFARGWAKVRGNRWFHLGGGVGGRPDSLFRFKCGFSKLRAPFSTWRVVASRTVYEGAVKIWESRHGLTADADDGFFPAYRKPVSTT